MIESGFRAGYVALIGEPNVGKSTLMNRLVGQKLSIVTPKPQTTRHRILGILSSETAQIIFLDTPGVLQPRYALHEAMMRFSRGAVGDADVVLFLVDACEKIQENDKKRNEALEMLKTGGKAAILGVNKVDAVAPEKVAEMIVHFSSAYKFSEVYPISAATGYGIEEMMKGVEAALPVHVPFYPVDAITEQPEKFFVAEIIREKIFEKFSDEIPYSTTVDILEFKEQAGKKDLIRAEIVVERDSQKGIIIGKGGSALKDIGAKSRAEIELFLDRPVFLELYVKTRDKWRESNEWVKRFGY
jgi:GTP-binding protein Era